ncbi:head maturation protease, ClpP-related [Phaeobacter italicus]|uniref:head maturation protease, ClpP-related n=2 Tax=Phaeobacter italicus TaxID=481446 RepID=UPI002FDE5CA0
MDGNDLILNGEIVLEGYIHDHETCEWMGAGYFSARMVRDALSSFSGDVTVRVNSNGGDPFEGEAARAAFEAHTGKVTVLVNGMAASAASLLIMGADQIELSAGSFIMIHDPSGGCWGTAEAHEAEAERLRTLASTYADVYADRSGLSSEEVKAMMTAETYMNAAKAVETGFADAVIGNPKSDVPEAEAIAAVQTQMARDHRQFLTRMQHFRASGSKPDAKPKVSMTNSQEAHEMPKDTNQQTTNPTPSATPPEGAAPSTTMANASEIEQAVMAERQRQSAIRTMAAPFLAAGQLTQMQIDSAIDQGLTTESASARFMTQMAATPDRVVPAAPVGARQDETETRMEGMIQALMSDYTGPGEQFRGMRVRGLAMELGGGSSFDTFAQVQRGMRSTTMMGGAHGVSDFAYITTEVMNRSLIAAYERRTANWQALTGTPMQASDFRELHAARFGGDFQLKKIRENGEYEEATLADEAEGLKVERRGRTINLTFEAVMNDDMGAFNRIPTDFAMAARLMEASMVWALLRSNAVLKSDKTALFHAKHKNIAPAGAIGADSVGKARKLMWEQKAFGSADGAEDFLMIEPDLLIVPPALETDAGKFIADVTPAKMSDANPWRASLTPVVAPHLGSVAQGGSDTDWYVASSDLPPITVAYLEGHQAPTVRTVEGMNPDKVTMTARHIFGAAPSEFRGIVKIPGQ